jgi:endo-1,4-beta-xylanase
MYHLPVLAVLVAAPLFVTAVPTFELTSRAEPCSIDTLMKAKGKTYFGVATDQNRLSVGKNSDIAIADFGCVTPENSMKWDQTEGLLI